MLYQGGCFPEQDGCRAEAFLHQGNRMECTGTARQKKLIEWGARGMLHTSCPPGSLQEQRRGVSRLAAAESLRKSLPPCCHRMFQTSMDFMRIKPENTGCQKKKKLKNLNKIVVNPTSL